MATILVIDTCSVFRFGIRALLEAEDGLEVITESGHSCLPEGQNQQAMIVPDVLVLSPCSPELALPDLVATYHQCFPETKILVLLNHENEANISQLIISGMTSCVLRCEPTEKLIQAIQAVTKGERYFSPLLLEKVVRPFTISLKQNSANLTRQEIEILRLVAEGNVNKEIASILQISERTVCNYLQSIRTKLDTQPQSEPFSMPPS